MVEAERMINRNQAKRDGTTLRLTEVGQLHLCRTHISSGGPLAAMGMSQVYTANDHGKVSGYKTIYPEDLHYFTATTCGGDP